MHPKPLCKAGEDGGGGGGGTILFHLASHILPSPHIIYRPPVCRLVQLVCRFLTGLSHKNVVCVHLYMRSETQHRWAKYFLG
jgi:hypothetical protein